jgi:hypothetical protein
MDNWHIEAGGQIVLVDSQIVPGDSQTTSPGGPTASAHRASTGSGADRTSSPATVEEDTDDDLLDYEPSPAHDDMEIHT